MTGPDQKRQREQQWWARWWLTDYSWSGLEKKPWVGWAVDLADGSIIEASKSEGRSVRPATLQDYWRDQQSDLVVGPDGVAFTKVHAPLLWKDGSSSEKTTWKTSALDSILQKKFATSAATQANAHGEIKGGVDRRCQLQGAVLFRAAFDAEQPDGEIHLNAHQAYFNARANYTGSVFGADASFLEACFGEEARFHTVRFKGRSVFEKSTFLNDANFYRATFDHLATFHKASFHGPVTFLEAKFEGTVWFWDVLFADKATFESASFKGSVSFSQSKFLGDAVFINGAFKSTTGFDSVTFSRVAAFEEATLHQDTTFDKAKFPAINRALRKCQLYFWLRLAAATGVAGLALALGGGWGTFFSVWAVLLFVASMLSTIWGGLTVGSDDNYERTIRAFRTLTLICEKLRNRKDAARFYKLELKTARLRPSTHPLERFFSWLFDLTADYGDSMLRPLVSLAGVVGFFAVMFWSWEAGAYHGSSDWSGSRFMPTPSAEPDPNFIDAAALSMSRAFPIGVWADSSDGTCAFSERLLASRDDRTPDKLCHPQGMVLATEAEVSSHRLAVSAAMTLETILALALYFLFGLAVRRKFQIG